jgi:HPr kinase/phosphorylase
LGEDDSCPIPSISVRELLSDAAEAIQLDVMSGGDGLHNVLNRATVQRPGLALTGFLEYIHSGVIQILGKAEIGYLRERPAGERSRILSQLCRQGAACFIVTSDLEPPPELVAEAEHHRVPLLRTDLGSAATTDYLTRYLEDRLAPRAVIHGTLMDVYGLGVLLLGDSGVGKSECALDLVVRGHRLVADDVVEIRRRREVLIGAGPELTRYHMELRGLGIINVRELFGVAAVRMSKFVEYVIRLDPWREGKRYDRLGLDENAYEILGMDLPYVEMPVGPGRNLSVLIEVAARNHLLKKKGFHPARELVRMLGKRLKRGARDEEEGQDAYRPAGLGREIEDGDV